MQSEYGSHAASVQAEKDRPPIRYIRLKDAVSWGCIGHHEDLADGARVTITTRSGDSRVETLGPAVDLPDEHGLVIHVLDRGEQALDPATPHFVRNPESSDWDVAGLAADLEEGQTREVLRRDGSPRKVTLGERLHAGADSDVVVHRVRKFHDNPARIGFTRKSERDPWDVRVPANTYKPGDTVDVSSRRGTKTVVLGPKVSSDEAQGFDIHSVEQPDPATRPPHFFRRRNDSEWLVSVVAGSLATGDRTSVTKADGSARDCTLGDLVDTTNTGRQLFRPAQFHDDPPRKR